MLLVMFLLLNKPLYVYISRAFINQVVARSGRQSFYALVWRSKLCAEDLLRFGKLSVFTLLFLHLS